MKFVLLIACRSGSNTLKDTLESISKAVFPTELEKVIVIENSGDIILKNTVYSFCEKMPIEYMHTSKHGKSVALNMAIRDYIADDRFILFTDDDVRVNEKWMVNYATAFSKYGKGNYFGAAMGVDYEEEPDPLIRSLLPASARGMDDSVYLSKTNEYFLGCNWAAHKSDLERAGLFHHEYGVGSKINSLGEENLVQLKLNELGVNKVLVPNNFVWHKVPREHCSWQWLKYRRERKGKTVYQNQDKNISWLVRSFISAGYYLLKSFSGNKENRYQFILKVKQIEGYLKAVAFYIYNSDDT